MNFYHLEEYIKLLKKQRIEREIFLAHGFDDDEALQELFKFDLQQLHSDAKFYHHLKSYIEDETELEIAAEPDSYFAIMDNIENVNLHCALSKLKPGELDILIRHAVYDESLKSIADRQGRSESTIRNAYARARKKIKKYF